jgi:poly(3-hydroxybutyrate) depolymerase
MRLRTKTAAVWLALCAGLSAGGIAVAYGAANSATVPVAGANASALPVDSTRDTAQPVPPTSVADLQALMTRYYMVIPGGSRPAP